MSGGEPIPMTGTWGERLLALLVVVTLACVGGVII